MADEEKQADKWWDSLPRERKISIRRWISPGRVFELPAKEQIALFGENK